MKPYYQDDAVTIYHGDCREILPHVSADVLVTDPPYGIGHVSGGGTGGKWHRVRHQGVTVAGDDAPFNPLHLVALGLPSVLWGANFYCVAEMAGGWLVWDKRAGIEDMTFNRSQAELAYCSEISTVRVFRHMWHGLCRSSEVGAHLHPTQKPVALMAWCIAMMPEGAVVDPYCGSGPTLRAAKDLGRKAIGIEIEERYCEIAARRCSQDVLQLTAMDGDATGTETTQAE